MLSIGSDNFRSFDFSSGDDCSSFGSGYFGFGSSFDCYHYGFGSNFNFGRFGFGSSNDCSRFFANSSKIVLFYAAVAS